MNLQYRIELLAKLGDYLQNDPPAWQEAKMRAEQQNGWFTPEFIAYATQQVVTRYLHATELEKWAASYGIADQPATSKDVGIIMAGNIPMVGLHDLLCVFVSGHRAVVKASSKDDVLIRHLVDTLVAWEPAVDKQVRFAPMLKGCDAYIATGSNNSAGYFEYYFGKYPSIIRRNRTSVAILDGSETPEQLRALADDVFIYFGLGCRNVTKLYVPDNYDFPPLLNAFSAYNYLGEHHKYKNNYDYNLAIHLLNKEFYMSTPALLLIETDAFFSPISQLNYSYYTDDISLRELPSHPDLQCIVGKGFLPFGESQQPRLADFADGVDTLQFLQLL